MTNAFAPRHADSALIQLLSESGVIGLVGVAVLVVIVGRAVVRSAPPIAAWAVAFFLASLATDNLTDTPGLAAAFLIWVAMIVPASDPPRGQRRRGMTVAAFVLMTVVTVAYVSISVAHFMHDEGIGLASRGRLSEAAAALEIATRLDPGHGAMPANSGLPTSHFPIPPERFPTCDVPVSGPDRHSDRARNRDSRARSGDRFAALTDIRRASAQMPASKENLFLEAAIAMRTLPAGDRDALIQAIQIDPLVVGAPGWQAAFGRYGSPSQLLLEAAVAIGTAQQTSVDLSYQPMWLSLMTGAAPSQSAIEGAARAGIPQTSRALSALLGCDRTAAIRMLELAQASEGDSGLYWLVRLIATRGSDNELAPRQLAQLAAPAITDLIGGTVRASPLSADAHDRRMYSRRSLPPLAGLSVLPSTEEARSAWLQDPARVGARSLPTWDLAECYESG